MGIYVHDFCYRKQMLSFPWVAKLIEWKTGVAGSHFTPERLSLPVNKASKGKQDQEIERFLVTSSKPLEQTLPPGMLLYESRDSSLGF